MTAVLILIVLATGFFVGWRAAVRFSGNKMIEENLFLRNHVEQLKATVSYWSQQSSYNKEIQNSTIANHNNNLKNSLDNLLFLIQNQPKESLKEEEKEKVENIIQSIKKGISPL